MNRNQNEYEKEINLVEFFFYCLKKWRGILVVMLIMAVCAGGYQYRAAVKNNLVKAEQLKALGEDAEDTTIVNPHVAAYKFAIEKGEEDLKKREIYLKESAFMQLDANHLQTGTLTFFVDCQEEGGITYLDGLISAYRIYVEDGQLAEQLDMGENGMMKADIQELVSFHNKESLDSEQKGSVSWPLQLLEEEESIENYSYIVQNLISSTVQPVFQIRIIAQDKELCQVYMDEIKKAIFNYSTNLQRNIVEHELRLVASSQLEQTDEGIQNSQSQALMGYMVLQRNLTILRNEMETVQKKEGGYISLGNPVAIGTKYAIMSLGIGAFMTLLVLFLCYVMSSKIQSVENFEKEYGMQLLARVVLPVGENKWFGFVDRWLNKLEEGAYASISFEEQIKIAAANVKTAILSNENLKKIMIAGTIGRNEMESIWEKFAEEMEGIQFSAYKQIVFSAADLEELDNYDGILFLEKRGISISKLIWQERELAEGRNKKVLGAVVF